MEQEGRQQDPALEIIERVILSPKQRGKWLQKMEVTTKIKFKKPKNSNNTPLGLINSNLKFKTCFIILKQNMKI